MQVAEVCQIGTVHFGCSLYHRYHTSGRLFHGSLGFLVGDWLPSHIHPQQSDVFNVVGRIDLDESHNRQVTLLVQIAGAQAPFVHCKVGGTLDQGILHCNHGEPSSSQLCLMTGLWGLLDKAAKPSM